MAVRVESHLLMISTCPLATNHNTACLPPDSHMDSRTSFVYSKNGTLQVINEQTPSPVAEGVILIICFLFGVGYNFIVTTAILSNNKLRTDSFYLLLLEVSVSCLLDCFTNESIAFELLLNNSISSCRFSATVFHLFLLSHSSSLGLLLLERSFALRDRPMTNKVCLGGVLASWVFGFLFLTPMFVLSEVHYFPNRNSCSSVKSNEWFSGFSLLGFLLVWGLMAISMFELICYINKYLNDRKQLNILSVFPITGSEIENSVLPLMTCSKNKISYTVIFLYTLLLLPLIISYCVTLFMLPSFLPDPWIDPSIQNYQIRSVLTNSLDPLFVYSRYIYNFVVPIIVLSSDRGIRLQSRHIFCLRRNAISSYDSIPINSRRNELLPGALTSSACTLSTPVLFATSKGLHLRAPHGSQTNHRASMSVSNSKIRLMTTFCDLTINLNAEQGSYELIKATRVTEQDEATNYKNKRYVRFSSKVDAISAPESRISTLSTAEAASSQSNTRIISTPLFVKGESQLSNNTGQTYTKI